MLLLRCFPFFSLYIIPVCPVEGKPSEPSKAHPAVNVETGIGSSGSILAPQKNDPFVFLKWFHICIKSNPCPENFRGRGHPSMLQAIMTGNYIRVPCYAAWQQKFFAPLQKNEEWLSRLPCVEWNHGAPIPTKAANHVRDERSIGLTVWDFRPSVLQMEHCTTSKRK